MKFPDATYFTTSLFLPLTSEVPLTVMTTRLVRAVVEAFSVPVAMSLVPRYTLMVPLGLAFPVAATTVAVTFEFLVLFASVSGLADAFIVVATLLTGTLAVNSV